MALTMLAKQNSSPNNLDTMDAAQPVQADDDDLLSAIEKELEEADEKEKEQQQQQSLEPETDSPARNDGSQAVEEEGNLGPEVSQNGSPSDEDGQGSQEESDGVAPEKPTNSSQEEVVLQDMASSPATNEGATGMDNDSLMDMDSSGNPGNPEIRDLVDSMVDQVVQRTSSTVEGTNVESDITKAINHHLASDLGEEEERESTSEDPDYDEGLSQLSDINKSNQHLLDDDENQAVNHVEEGKCPFVCLKLVLIMVLCSPSLCQEKDLH